MKGQDMAAPPVRMLVFMTGRNCEMYVEEAIRSIARQTHPHVSLLYIDDASDDHSAELAQSTLNRLLPGQHRFIANPQREGKAFNASVHLRAMAPQYDAVAVVDADDCLVDPTVLARLAECYAAGKDVVWTNFVTDRGRRGRNDSLNVDVSPRMQRWATSHLFSFRSKLLLNVPAHYFKYPDGRWLDAACDLAIAYPVLDQTRRYQFLPVFAYRYTESNPASHHNCGTEPQTLSSVRQRTCAQIVIGMPELPRVDLPPKPNQVPAQGAAPWETVFAGHLAAQAPTLMDEIPVAELMRIDPILCMDGLQWLKAGRRNVLILGDSTEAAALRILSEKFAAHCVHLVSVDPSNPESHHAGTSARPAASLQRTYWAEYTLDADTVYLPDLSVLGPMSFDTVFIMGGAWGPQRAPAVAIAALADRINLENIKIWMCDLTEEERLAGMTSLNDLMPDMPWHLGAGRVPPLVLQHNAT